MVSDPCHRTLRSIVHVPCVQCFSLHGNINATPWLGARLSARAIAHMHKHNKHDRREYPIERSLFACILSAPTFRACAILHVHASDRPVIDPPLVHASHTHMPGHGTSHTHSTRLLALRLHHVVTRTIRHRPLLRSRVVARYRLASSVRCPETVLCQLSQCHCGFRSDKERVASQLTDRDGAAGSCQ